MKNILVVESPTKAKVIRKYLNNNKFTIIATQGHLRDLPKKFLGLDLKNNFAPTFHFLPGRKKIASYINKMAEDADIIYISTDPDREGEAIGWHITQVVNTFNGNYKRLLLHEITREYLYSELSNPKNISMNLVNSQLARRIVDRLFGYMISPYVSKNLKIRGSAGRVQSPTLRLMYEKDLRIRNFKSESFLEIKAKFLLPDRKNFISAKLKNWRSYEKIPYRDDLIKEIKEEIEKSAFFITNVKEEKISKVPPPPFNTYSLLIESAKNFNWSSYKTQKIAQILYEGVNLNDKYMSLITYIRTDSLRMNENFLRNAALFIKRTDFKEYLNPTIRRYKTADKFAQEAHEAIRPIDLSITPDSIQDKVVPPLYKLYELIWRRTIATQLKSATYQKFHFEITNQIGNLFFISEYKYLVDNGYKVIYNAVNEYVPEYIKNIKTTDKLELINIDFNKIETVPPKPYTEATIIKELKKFGIGRPSTYAYILHTLIKRKYIKKIKGYLQITEKGIKTIEFLLKNFTKLIDYNFTEKLEKELDMVEHGEKEYLKVIESFYKELKELIARFKSSLS